MNRYKKIISIIQIPIKLMLVVLMIFVSYEYLNEVFANKKAGDSKPFLAMPENSIDAIVLGSSDSQYSFVPSFFYEDTGLYSYVRGSACQPLEVSYEMLKDTLKTQKPRLAILEVFTAMPLKKTCEDDMCYVFAEYQMTGREKYNTIDYLPEEKAKEYKNDFINNHNDWRTLTNYKQFITVDMFNNQNKIDNYFGYVYQYGNIDFPNNYWSPNEYKEDVPFELDKMDLDSLNNIYNLCKENNIELLLYKTPIDGITQEDQSALHEVWKWADEHNVKYIDFVSKSKEMKFFMQIHTDAFHCFVNGASMITGYISDFVNQNYVFDHVENDMLDKEYEANVWELTKKVLCTEFDPLVYLKRLVNTKGTICLRFNTYEDKQIGQGLYNSICNLGCSRFDYNNNYYAIIKDGRLIYESDKPFKYDLDNNKIEINDEKIIINDTIYNNEGSISLVYADSEDLNQAVIKNFDYIPFPWDHNEKVYMAMQ